MPLRMKAVCDTGHSNSLLSTREKHLIPAVSIKISIQTTLKETGKKGLVLPFYRAFMVHEVRFNIFYTFLH